MPRSKSRLDFLGAALSGEAADHARSYVLVDIDKIRPDPQQPRRHFSEAGLKELAASMSATTASGKPRGVISPLSVRSDKDNPRHYIINSGERRWRASQIAGLDSVPVVIQEDSTFSEQLIENIQREDLSAEEIAESIDRMINVDGLTGTEIATRLGKGRDWVSLYRQFGAAPEIIRSMHTEGFIVGARTVVEVARAYEKEPERIGGVLNEIRRNHQQGLTRSEMLRLVSDKDTTGQQEQGQVAESGSAGVAPTTREKGRGSKKTSTRQSTKAADTKISAPPAIGPYALAVSWSDDNGSTLRGYLCPERSSLDNGSIAVIDAEGVVSTVLISDLCIEGLVPSG
jgi:ParB family chromosome partitioning protein